MFYAYKDLFIAALLLIPQTEKQSFFRWIDEKIEWQPYNGIL